MCVPHVDPCAVSKSKRTSAVLRMLADMEVSEQSHINIISDTDGPFKKDLAHPKYEDY